MTTQIPEKALTKPAAKKELREWLQGETFKRELQALLPRTMSPERFVRIAFQAIHKNPDLIKCTQESFFNCLLSLGAMGLEPDGRRAHLIPFGTECTLVVDYKGIKELVRRNRDVSAMHCDVVGANDEFEVRFGSRGVLDHKPNLEERGKILCAYSWVRLPDGAEEFDVMSVAEIEAIRKRSRSPNKGPWVTDWNEMAKKTVFRRHAKGLPLSPQTAEALERDHDADSLATNFKEEFASLKQGVRAVSAAPALKSVQSARQPELPVEEESDHAAAQSDGESEVSPASAAPTVSLQAEVRNRLAQAGYSEPELLELLKRLKIAPLPAVRLEDCAEDRLVMVLEDWDTCTDRLNEARKLGKSAA